MEVKTPKSHFKVDFVSAIVNMHGVSSICHLNGKFARTATHLMLSSIFSLYKRMSDAQALRMRQHLYLFTLKIAGEVIPLERRIDHQKKRESAQR